MRNDFYRVTVITVSVAIVVVLALTFLPFPSGVIVQTTPQTVPPKVIVDAGHGGFDGGAVADDGVPEKDINLEIAKKLEHTLTALGVHVIMTRSADEGLESSDADTIRKKKISDMRKRLEIIESNDDAIFVSIHLNKFSNKQPTGTQVFYSVNNDGSAYLAQLIQDTTRELLQKDNHRLIKKGTSDTILLHKSEIPAVIVECGFLSNPDEYLQLKDNQYQTKMAVVIATGIMKYFGGGV